ncbi:hypothetical protein C1903_08190 [Listeria ivanovii]|uniref:alpha/beta fold hydrolase n=1 Tax=Listeria ivanovii TaxID=1638 RepID=UPI000DA94338|nr:alpha/beta hydrolase [Listeria ivanovii]PZF88942.1 hypothetical protein C1905_08345 [Listeria ivanovii]PZF94156.1 hypothetical protein C1903_08190 [Listeria ivanovii]PZG04880.1 hypothetical protein C2L88_07715 [Listeria ivanovii]PZG09332.1 hypothetical protein C1901_08070 [Listeria ivanovii]PZG26292.1 hypothetical protein C1900_08355 [Listeria ivanovii]
MAEFIHDSITFHYEEQGSGMPIIYLHGLGGDLQQPFTHFPEIKNYRFISLDFRGHGKTRYFVKESDFSFETFAGDVIALMNHLKFDSTIIGGISTGAGVALHIALHFPSRVCGLILSRVAWKDEPQPPQIQTIFKEVANHIQNFGVTEGKKRFLTSTEFLQLDELSPAAADSLVKQFDYPYINETHAKLVQIPQDTPNTNRENWRNIAVPTLILANKIDPVHPFHYGKLLSYYIPQSTFKEITPKAVSNDAHVTESKQYIYDFINSTF